MVGDRCKFLDPSLNWDGVSEAEDFAAHWLHKTHLAWVRSAIDSTPHGCYQCHVFARIVAKALAQHEQPSD